MTVSNVTLRPFDGHIKGRKIVENDSVGTHSVKLVLSGFYANKTIVLNGVHFVEGVAEVLGSPSGLEGIIKYMARSYEAFPEGSKELLAMQGMQNGVSSTVQEAAGEPSELAEVPTVHVKGIGPDAEEKDVLVGSDDDAKVSRSNSTRSSRGGHKYSRVLSDEQKREQALEIIKSIREALISFPDCDDPDYFNRKTGLPQPKMIMLRAGLPNGFPLTKALIEAAYPGYNREEARRIWRAKDLEATLAKES